MNTIRLLLATFERRTNNLVEVVARDACFGQAVVNCVRTSRIDELFSLATRHDFDVIIVAPDHLVPEPSRKTSHVAIEESLRTIQRIKNQTGTPVIAVCVPQGFEIAAIEAGAEIALGLFFKAEALEAEIRRVLNLSQPVQAAPQIRVSLAGAFWRALQRFVIPRTQ